MRVKGHRGHLTAEHFRLMRLPCRFWEVSFDQITSELRDIIGGYCRNVDRMLDNGEGLLLWGPNGRGKTAAAAFVAKEVRRTGATVLMVTAASLIDSVLEKTKMEDDGLLIDRARTVDFLLLDDLGKEHPSASGFSDRILENLFRERGAARLTTWITCNMDPDGLRQRYKKSMLEVLKEQVVPLKVEGDNRRDDAQSRIRESIAV